MVGIKFAVHPLFLIFGFYYALSGEILVFIIYTLSALAHEIGHSLCADKYGYKLNKITLMPFGAVASGNISGLKLKDEIRIALAGPLVNLIIALFFVASWWIKPEIYAVTDTLVLANFSLALINLLPAKALDGGRVLFALLALKIGDKKATLTCRLLGLGFSLVFIVLFIISLTQNIFNFSTLFFALFLLVGALEKNTQNKYVKVYSSLKKDKLMRGASVKIHAISKDMRLKKLLSILDERAVNEIEVYDGEDKIAYLTQKKINEIMENGDLYMPVKNYI